MENMADIPVAAGHFDSMMRDELLLGDWEGLFKTSSESLLLDINQPVATFLQNMACLFINPPAIMRNRSYLEKVNIKDWKVVERWFKDFQSESDQHNPYFQALDFILQPASKKKSRIEGALQEHPSQPELLFFQAVSLRDRNTSIEKLKLAVENKPEFPAAIFLLGIFSLQMNKVEVAKAYLTRAVEQAPNFVEAHYQLGSLYMLYTPDGKEKAAEHFRKVIELDPEGGAGKDAKKVLDNGAEPQYGQRIDGGVPRQRGGMSIFTILGISLLTFALFSGPIASLFKITNPTIGILAGLFVFIGLYSALGRRR